MACAKLRALNDVKSKYCPENWLFRFFRAEYFLGEPFRKTLRDVGNRMGGMRLNGSFPSRIRTFKGGANTRGKEKTPKPP